MPRQHSARLSGVDGASNKNKLASGFAFSFFVFLAPPVLSAPISLPLSRSLTGSCTLMYIVCKRAVRFVPVVAAGICWRFLTDAATACVVIVTVRFELFPDDSIEGEMRRLIVASDSQPASGRSPTRSQAGVSSHPGVAAAGKDDADDLFFKALRDRDSTQRSSKCACVNQPRRVA